MTDDRRAWWRHRSLGTRRELTLSTGRLAYFEAGAGEPIVLLHGPLTNANVWRKVVAALSGRFRCIALDLPFGAHFVPMPDADLSFAGLAAIVTEALEALDLREVTLVGNDGGTPVAQLVATTRPDLVRRLVLTAGGAYDNCPPRRYRAIMKAIAYAPAARELILGPLRIRALRRLPMSYGWLARRPVEPATSDSWVLPALESDAVYADLRRMLRSLEPSAVLAAAESFGDFPGPVLVVWSREDRVFPPEHAERLAGDFADAGLEWIADSCSLLPEDKPFEVAQLLADFVQRTSSVPAAAISTNQES
ncbi:alpha/beta hydrolase [Rhodococcus ruber]|uniref:Putative hydrolase n=1 Tax=Rhodococcus ruber TaxID=1830 RepID=A0A098BQU6_9NOCA|nr:alpha/beta hydrolase [Rhodococcus ruber]MCD2127556.1 alpha/beta hydrolase [Rhodococcus ruber]MCZ4504154.1 alpha/beta hydrolase [Rhodococcus ruber]MCZ4531304.1 alpha/beta hydrolase [Rhodococcus ruber]MCZ4621952.1 alpha/beta hydrolase [Rhodococcus ruber]MDI9968654.1 alpha/beta hydrolase [Rhodococcus ruber]